MLSRDSSWVMIGNFIFSSWCSSVWDWSSLPVSQWRDFFAHFISGVHFWTLVWYQNQIIPLGCKFSPSAPDFGPSFMVQPTRFITINEDLGHVNFSDVETTRYVLVIYCQYSMILFTCLWSAQNFIFYLQNLKMGFKNGPKSLKILHLEISEDVMRVSIFK